jgi:predicted nucleic acid-binding protein
MIAEARLIKDYEFQPTDNLLMDANVWLMLYGPQGDPSSYRTRVYSDAFKRMLSARSTIHIDVLVTSEFINSYARLEWRLAIKRGLGAEFKEFRDSDEFPPVAQRIAADAKLLLQRCQCIESGFSTSDIAGVLTEYETGRKDFNDQMLADMCTRSGLILVTNDADFKASGPTVLTANKRLLP